MKSKVLTVYNPNWVYEFKKLKECYATELAGLDVVIEHVGSTAIVGLPAKPIIDVDIILKNQSQLGHVSERLLRLGYESRGEQGIAGRFAFRQTSESVPYSELSAAWQSHHLYVCYLESLALKNHITFRDALQANQKLKNQYADLKWELFRNPDIDRIQYNIMKTDFILSVLRDAGFNEDELIQIKATNV